jgi:hypothetical protein
MNELGAEFDWTCGVRGRDCEDAPAYTIAGFEDFDVNANVMQRTRRSQAGGTRADHHHHGGNVMQLMTDER